MALGASLDGELIGARWLGDAGPQPILIFGGIHGDEPDSVTFCARFLEQARLAAPVFVAPAINPDGLAAQRKNNARDVDLNRNFPARNWRREHAPGYDPGPAPGSEPETQALVKLIDDLRPRLVVAVHQPLACVNWDGPAAAFAAALAPRIGLPLAPSIGYPTPGSFGSWLGVDRGVPVITLELGRAPVPAATILAGVHALAATIAEGFPA